MSRCFVAAIILLVLVPVAVEAQYVDSLGGTWEWVSTTYTAGGTDTPASVGYTTQLHFGTDRSFVRYRDEVPQATSSWYTFDIVVSPYMIEVLATGAGDEWISHAVSCCDSITLVLGDAVELPVGLVGPNTRTETYEWRVPVANEQSNWGQLKAAFR